MYVGLHVHVDDKHSMGKRPTCLSPTVKQSKVVVPELICHRSMAFGIKYCNCLLYCCENSQFDK